MQPDVHSNIHISDVKPTLQLDDTSDTTKQIVKLHVRSNIHICDVSNWMCTQTSPSLMSLEVCDWVHAARRRTLGR